MSFARVPTFLPRTSSSSGALTTRQGSYSIVPMINSITERKGLITMALKAESMDKLFQALPKCSDEQLIQLNRSLVANIKARRRNRAMDMAATLREGSKVRIKGLRPQYLNGLTGTIEDFGNTRVTVKLDRGPIRKFRSGRVVCSPAALELI